MNLSIMFSASKFSAHVGQPRAFCSSTFPQSRHVFALIAAGPSAVVLKDNTCDLPPASACTTLLAQGRRLMAFYRFGKVLGKSHESQRGLRKG